MASAEQPPAVDPVGRLWSIDALRGFDMFWIVGGGELVLQLAKWAQWRYQDVVERQLEHAGWLGFTFEDLIFPLFLFLVGAVLPFSLAKLDRPGESRWPMYDRILRRTLLLYIMGLIYYGREGVLALDFANQRYMGVLQRIAICYGIAALITVNTRTVGRVIFLVTILAGYWALLTFVAAPGGSAGDLSKETNLAGYVDRMLLPGKTWVKDADGRNLYDNEGILSTLPAVATTLLGVLAGEWLRSRRGALAKTAGLAAAGAACLAGGLAWCGALPGTESPWNFPLIKNLWTSSYVLVAGGWSLLLLALFYGVIDGLGWRSWAFFFVVVGANAITIYFARECVDFNYTAEFFFGGLIDAAKQPNRLGPAFFPVGKALAVLAVEWLLLYILFRNRVFLRV
jgi:predicted acyltransferase